MTHVVLLHTLKLRCLPFHWHRRYTVASLFGQHLLKHGDRDTAWGESAAYPEGEGVHGQAMRMSTLDEPPARHACVTSTCVRWTGIARSRSGSDTNV